MRRGLPGGHLSHYLACSLLVVFGLRGVFDQLSAILSRLLEDPRTLEILVQIAIGTAMLFFGSRMADARQSTGAPDLGPEVTATQAFGAGAGLTLIGMPGALPLFAAVEQILQAELGAAAIALAMLYWNAIFILPLSLVLVMRLVLGRRIEETLRRLEAWMTTQSRRVVTWGLILAGVFLVVDGIAWLLGYPSLAPPDAALGISSDSWGWA